MKRQKFVNMLALLLSKLRVMFVFAVGTIHATTGKVIISFSSPRYPGLKGSIAFFECEWNSPRPVSAIIFSSVSKGPIYHYNIQPPYNRSQYVLHKGVSFDESRMSASVYQVGATYVKLTLSGLKCVDEGFYECTMHGHNRGRTEVDKDRLTLIVPPNSPTVTIVPGHLSSGIFENDTIKLTCKAITGNTGIGTVRWRLYRRGVREDILPPDMRLTKHLVTYPDACSQHVESELTMTVTRRDHNLVAVCFVVNDEFAPVLSLPSTCLEVYTLCSEMRLTVFHPVSDSEITVTRDPEEGCYRSTMVLTCKAEGYPAPNIVWLKDDTMLSADEDNDITGTSRLVLPNFPLDGSTGVYICVANNTLNGFTYIASKNITICDDDFHYKSPLGFFESTFPTLVVFNFIICIFLCLKKKMGREETQIKDYRLNQRHQYRRQKKPAKQYLQKLRRMSMRPLQVRRLSTTRALLKHKRKRYKHQNKTAVKTKNRKRHRNLTVSERRRIRRNVAKRAAKMWGRFGHKALHPYITDPAQEPLQRMAASQQPQRISYETADTSQRSSDKSNWEWTSWYSRSTKKDSASSWGTVLPRTASRVQFSGAARTASNTRAGPAINRTVSGTSRAGPGIIRTASDTKTGAGMSQTASNTRAGPGIIRAASKVRIGLKAARAASNTQAGPGTTRKGSNGHGD